MGKTYKDGYWIFVYWPVEDFLMMLFKGTRKGYWPYGTTVHQAAPESLSEHGLKSLRDKDWQSYFVDTALTKDWKEAYNIAGAKFGKHYDEKGLLIA